MARIGIRKQRITTRSTTDSPMIDDKPRYTLEEAYLVFESIKRLNNLKEKTIRSYKQSFDCFAQWIKQNHGDEITVDKINLQIIRNYITWCSVEKVHYEGHPFKFEKDKQGLSPASVNVRIRTLKTFFKTLFDEEMIDKNPTDKLTLLKTEQDTVRPLTEEELKRLLKAPDQAYYPQFRDYIIMILILDTGMRLNEICNLEKKELDILQRQIVLPGIKNKNRKARVLPLSNSTAKLLFQLIKETEVHFHSDYVFLTHTGERLNEKTLQWSFNKYAEEAGLKGKVSPHVLRHNFATMSALNGMTVFTLQKLLGHADITTTRKYIQIDDRDARIEHEKTSPVHLLLRRK